MIFSPLISGYIEETSASISRMYDSSIQSSSLISAVDPSISTVPGEGGQQILAIQTETVQESSFLVPNPPSTDYVESSGSSKKGITEYTVQPGDNLSFIASDYGVTTNSIIWANNLRSADSISPGQVLRIPPVSGVIHKIAQGDSISTISKKYGVDESEIISFNEIENSGEISIGDEIIVPGGKIVIPKTVAKAKATGAAKRFAHLPDLGGFYIAPTTGYNWGIIHGRNGIDIANSCGTPIYASTDGKVTAAYGTGWNGGFGKYIKLGHSNNTESLYAHLSKLVVSSGESVSKGQLIGLMGTTGRSTGCHLHFEVHGAKNPMVK